MFDFSKGEPPQDYLTILRALEVHSLAVGSPAVVTHAQHVTGLRPLCAPSAGQHC